MRTYQKLEGIPEWELVRETLAGKLDMKELQLRQLESEIETRPFDSLDFVGLVIEFEEVFGITIPLARKVDLAQHPK